MAKKELLSLFEHRKRHHDRTERNAKIMIATALIRVAVWSGLLIIYSLNLTGVHHLYSETAFVTILSILALLLTDWGQFAASLAQLAATRAHREAEDNAEKLSNPRTSSKLPSRKE